MRNLRSLLVLQVIAFSAWWGGTAAFFVIGGPFAWVFGVLWVSGMILFFVALWRAQWLASGRQPSGGSD